MKREQHRLHHEELHRSLELLVADYMQHHGCALPSNTTIAQLLEWSRDQTIEPNELEPVRVSHSGRIDLVLFPPFGATCAPPAVALQLPRPWRRNG